MKAACQEALVASGLLGELNNLSYLLESEYLAAFNTNRYSCKEDS
jgi:hypothetical protein